MCKCPKCGSHLNCQIKGHGVSLKCEKCDYSIATSYFEDWYYDTTKYSIYIQPTENISIDKLKYIAKKCQMSIIKIKQELSKNSLFLKNGYAYELKDDIIDMNEKGIEYEIIPNFKYTFN